MTTDTRPATATERVQKRRKRLQESGWRLVQVELSPAATLALGAYVASGETRSQVVERLLMGTRKKKRPQ